MRILENILPENNAIPVKGRVAHIDGLRGIAVLIILLFHLDVTWLKSGFIGVDIFFVISGFLITQIIASELAENRFSFTNFYARRIRRIFPALFVMLLGTSLAAIAMLGPSEFSAFFKTLRYAGAQASNILFSHEVDYFAVKNETSPLLHTWSLGVEEQFYLLWPLILYLAHRFFGIHKIHMVLIALFLASLGMSEYFLPTHPLHVFYLLPARAWELALGGIVALGIIPQITHARLSQFLSLLGLVMIGVAAFTINKLSFPGFSAVLPCLGTALVIYAGRGRTDCVHQGLAFKPLVWVGLVSYSLYLWHWPLITFYKTLEMGPLDVKAQIVIGGLSFLLATISYYLVEEPTSRMTLKPKLILIFGFLMIIIAVVGSNIIKRADMANWRMTYEIDKTETRPNEFFDVCASPRGVLNLKDCIIGPHKDAYEVILAGDSHASHYAPTVIEWARSRGLTVRLMLRGACQAWVKTERPPIKDGAIDKDCIKIREEFYETLQAQSSVKYLFLSLKLPKDHEDIKTNLQNIKAYHKTTIFLGSAPVFEQNPHDCMAKQNLLIAHLVPHTTRNPEHCKTFDPDYVTEQLKPTRTDFVARLKSLDIPYFDPIPFMPTAFDSKGHFLYMDTDHLNKYGGQALAEPLIQFMNTVER